MTRRVLFTLLFELVALNAVILALLYFRTLKWEAPDITAKMVIFAATSTGLIQFGFWSFGLYSRKVIYSGRMVYQNLLSASVLLAVALFVFSLLFSRLGGDPIFDPSLKFFPVLLGVIFPLVVCVERFAILHFFNGDCHLGNVLILGTGESTRRVILEARAHHGESLRFVGILGESREKVGAVIDLCSVIGSVSQLRHAVEDLRVKTLIIALPYDHPDLPLDYLLECKLAGINVLDAGSFYESVSQKILLEKLEPVSVLFPEGYTMTRVRWLAKEACERLLALIVLGVLAVPLAAVYLLVLLTSPGGGIYRQVRVGKSGRHFTLYKFRTMVQDAEKSSGAAWAEELDPRVTWLGRWLRRTRIDELPQLFNILKGDMAFVGPRPERPEFVEYLRQRIPFYHHRHFVKPGLTGWAQIQFPYARSLEDSREKLRYDLYYVKNMSLFFDWMILLATIRAVIRGSGVR